MDSSWTEWINVVFRFAHVVAGIMWIGNSLLFTWMELNLIKPRDEKDPDLLGTLDMLHGGGVFHLEKRLMRADAIPSPLHWFKWQSYTTWITGFVLLGALFLSNGNSLLDPAKSDLGPGTAAALSLAGIFGGWLVYDALWRSPLRKHPVAGLAISLGFIAAAAAAYGSIFNGRALFLQIGAMMGTCMSANVFFHIITNQHRFMRALRAGQAHDPEYGKRAKARSLHNHYMTFPVVFLMLSAHFPRLYSTPWNVPVLLTVIAALMAVKHLMNTRYHFRGWLASIFAVVTAASLLIAFFLQQSPASTPPDPGVATGKKVFETMACATCHMQGGGAIAPALEGLHGSTVELADGSSVVADDAYLRRSILEPQAEVVKGYAPAMPSYAGRMSDQEMNDLLAWLKSLRKP